MNEKLQLDLEKHMDESNSNSGERVRLVEKNTSQPESKGIIDTLKE